MEKMFENQSLKCWSELEIEEKVERMRKRVKSLEVQFQQVEKVLSSFAEHVHDGDNKLLVPFSLRELYGGWGGEDDIF